MIQDMKKIALNSALVVTTFFSISLSTAVYADPPVAPFYESVMKMAPNGKLGQVIKKEQIRTSIKGAQSWRIAYISSDVSGNKTISTGLIIAPIGPAPKEGRPIMSWAHGTTGSAQNCGPSQVLDPAVPLNQYYLIGGNSWTDYGIPSANEFIAQGYVLAATDYQGLGGGGKHQYVLAATNAMDTINAARAASSMKEVGAGKRVIVYGWSQGGGAVINAASMPEYLSKQGTAADNLELLGGVALAPQDIAVLMPGATLSQANAEKALAGAIDMFSNNVFNFTHMAMGMWGTQAANPNLKLSDLFTDNGVQVLNEVFSNKCMHATADTLSFNFGSNFKSLLKDKQSNQLEWVKAMVKGSVNPVKPVAPVVIYWGTKDTTNPPIMGKLYQEQMCKLGGSVERVQLSGEQNHFTTPGTSAPLYRAWIKDRLDGKPVTDNCALAAQLPIN